MLREPFSRPQAGYSGGNVYEAEPGLNDAGGVGFRGRLGNIRPRSTMGGLPAQPMNQGPMPPPMQTGGGAPMSGPGPAPMNPGPLPPHLQPGLPPPMPPGLAPRTGGGLPPAMPGNPGVPFGARLPAGGAMPPQAFPGLTPEQVQAMIAFGGRRF